MNAQRFKAITGMYPRLQIAVLGDFCLDRYLEIDPTKRETSIETGLPVYNVVNVRSQPGAAGTILNNLVSLGIGEIIPIGFCGEDGEGYELMRALGAGNGVRLDHFAQTTERRTFTYCKPLIVQPDQLPRELNRLDSKNWLPTPGVIQEQIINSIGKAFGRADALIVMDQVDLPETGVVTQRVLSALAEISRGRPDLCVLADSRRGLTGYPDIGLKMNEAELRALTGKTIQSVDDVRYFADRIATEKRRPVFVTLAERGIVGAWPKNEVAYVPAFPVRGAIDIVGAGDAVMANLTAALAAGATLGEALELAMAAASVVIHQLGTTGIARVEDLRMVLFSN